MRDVMAVQVDRSRAHARESANRVDEHGLSRTVRANDAKNLATSKLEAHTIDGSERSERDHQVRHGKMRSSSYWRHLGLASFINPRHHDAATPPAIRRSTAPRTEVGRDAIEQAEHPIWIDDGHRQDDEPGEQGEVLPRAGTRDAEHLEPDAGSRR